MAGFSIWGPDLPPTFPRFYSENVLENGALISKMSYERNQGNLAPATNFLKSGEEK